MLTDELPFQLQPVNPHVAVNVPVLSVVPSLTAQERADVIEFLQALSSGS